MVLPSIEVREYGPPPRCVAVLHGGPGAQGSAAGLARLLADRVGVIEPLQRRSGAIPLTVAQHVADLSAVCTARTLIGHSWGAMLALSFAAAHPDRVDALVLVGCGTYDEPSRLCYADSMEERLGELGRRRRDELVRELAATDDERRATKLLAAWGDLAAAAQTVDAIEPPDAVEPDPAGNEETWSDVLHRQRTGEEPASFAAIRVPVLMIHGDDDPHPGPMISDSLGEFIPTLEYVGLPRCGHEPWRERFARDAFAETVVGWLGAHSSARESR